MDDAMHHNFFVSISDVTLCNFVNLTNKVDRLSHFSLLLMYTKNHSRNTTPPEAALVKTIKCMMKSILKHVNLTFLQVEIK